MALDIKSRILKSLKSTNFGKSIKKIAVELDLSRTTVSKYLKILDKENRCINRKVGFIHSGFQKKTKNF
ncbi:MAG: HTH domain-containing protein [Candidatus Helarchaeota archaeon]